MIPNKVTVIDYGLGNLHSVRRGLEKSGAVVNVTSNHKEILKSKKIVLPGVGAFENAMKSLKELGLVDIIHEANQKHIPILGICLGMQLLFDRSEEFGVSEGLGLISGNVMPLPNVTSSGEKLKIPHIGWNRLLPSDNVDWKDTLMKNIKIGEAVYFVHSFMAIPSNSDCRVAECIYGDHKISSVVSNRNITGCQFHPEKSGKVGLKILREFCVD